MRSVESGYLGLAVLGISACLSSFVVGYGVFGLLRACQVIDRPNERSSHVRPTIRGGGIGIMAVILTVAGWLGWREREWIVGLFGVAALVLALVSFWDDRKPLPWRVRLGAHFGAAFAMLVGLFRAEPPVSPAMAGLFGLLIMLWFMGYANAFNFMDGINGLAAGQALVAGVGTAIVGAASGLPAGHPAVVLAIALAGAAAGFLPHNFPRARMFMGDVGSVPLGFMLAVLTIWVARDAGWWLVVPLGLLHMNFWMDSGVTLLRRILRGDALHQAHREHFYQRLNRSGWSHASVTGWELGLQILVLVLVVLAIGRGPSAMIMIVPVVIGVWMVFFAFCERRFVGASKRCAEPGE
jgi:UDP-N-acetylmuramyl pentapeptide phosphotransferase/UDP-N-acetylglucosamine-1-phosphate transferase